MSEIDEIFDKIHSHRKNTGLNATFVPLEIEEPSEDQLKAKAYEIGEVKYPLWLRIKDYILNKILRVNKKPKPVFRDMGFKSFNSETNGFRFK